MIFRFFFFCVELYLIKMQYALQIRYFSPAIEQARAVGLEELHLRNISSVPPLFCLVNGKKVATDFDTLNLSLQEMPESNR